MNHFVSNPLRFSLALLAGALLTLAFAPFNIFLCAVLSPALLLMLLLNVSAKQGFWRGLLYGLGFFSTGVYWIFISIHTYGNTTSLIALLITSSLMVFLALFPATLGYVLNRYFTHNNEAKIVYAFPAIWVALEWLRSWLFTGFPWLLLGYSQINSPLKGYAPILSVYGVSFLTLVSSALLVYAGLQFKQGHSKGVWISLSRVLLIWIVGAALSMVSWTKPHGEPIQISLVQGNIAQNLKWSPDQVQPTLDRYVNMTAPHWNSKIIIWPEAAIPLSLQTAEKFINDLDAAAKKHNSTVITGIPIQAPQSTRFYNGVIATGMNRGVYLKHRLVPFGEYIPFRNLLGNLMDLLHVPMSDFISSEKILPPLVIDGMKMATFICYEIAYPEQVSSRKRDVNMLLTVSNDAWFGDSIAQAQHIEMAQMRALEMGRPVLFASNDGITGVINAKGKKQSVAPPHKAYVLTDKVQAMEGRTPWQVLSMDPILSLLIVFLVFAIRQRKNVA